MSFFREFHPEIKTFLVVAAIAITLAVAGILLLQSVPNQPQAQSTERPVSVRPQHETEPQEKVELTDELIEKVKEKLLQTEYARQDRRHWIWRGDINDDGVPELAVVQVPVEEALPQLEIVSIVDKQGNYNKVAQFDFTAIKEAKDYLLPSSFHSVGSPALNLIGDINHDGLFEIHIGWNSGALRPTSDEAFLIFDWEQKTISLMEFLNGEGQKIVLPRLLGARGTNSGGFWMYSLYIGNTDDDRELEIVQLFEDGPSPYETEEFLIDQWRTEVYDWNGSLYAYSDELSSSGEGSAPLKLLEKLQVIDYINSSEQINVSSLLNDGLSNWQTYRNNEFGFELRYPEGWIINEEEFDDAWLPGEARVSLAYTSPPSNRLIRSITFSDKTLQIRVDVVRHFSEYPLSGYISPESALPLHGKFEDLDSVIAGEEIVVRKKFPDQSSFTLGTSPLIRNDLYFYLVGKSGVANRSSEELLLQILSTFRFTE